MLKKIAGIFYKDIGWKILSLIAACVLWLVGVNMSNPMQNHTIRQRVQLNNIEILATEGIMLLNEAELRDTLIQVGVRAHRHNMDLLRLAEISDVTLFDEMVNVSIDFRAINSEVVHSADGEVTILLDISPNLYHDIEHFSIRPSYVEVQLDAIASTSFPVEVVRHGEVAQDSWFESVNLANNHVTVTGARSLVRDVRQVLVNLDVSGLYEDTELSVALRVLDTGGNDITDELDLSVSSTTAFINVWPVRQLPFRVEFTGELAEGFAVYEYTVEPEFMSVAARSFEDVYSIVLKVELDGASENALRTVNVEDNLPHGVYLVHGERPYVAVFINIETISTRTINVLATSVRITGVEAIYQNLSEAPFFPITVRGPQSKVQQLAAADIFLDLNLVGLPVGSHNIRLQVTVPEGITVVSAAPQMLILIETPAAVVEVDEYEEDVENDD